MLIFWANQKGGVGKTTLSVHHAGYLAEQGYSVALFDADAQRSAAGWIETADPRVDLTISSKEITEVPTQLLEIGPKYDHVIIDGPGGLGEETRTIMLLADLILMPVTPSLLDLRSLKTSIANLEYVKATTRTEKPAFLVGNKVAKNGKKSRELETMADKIGLPMMGAKVRYLEAFKDAAQDYCFVWQYKREKSATGDIKTLFSEIDGFINPVMKAVQNG